MTDFLVQIFVIFVSLAFFPDHVLPAQSVQLFKCTHPQLDICAEGDFNLCENKPFSLWVFKSLAPRLRAHVERTTPEKERCLVTSKNVITELPPAHKHSDGLVLWRI